MSAMQIEPLGDGALLIRFGDRIDPAVNALALAATKMLRAADLLGIRDIAPAYASVCISYDPTAWLDPDGKQSPYGCLARRISELVEKPASAGAAPASTLVEIPVCYGAEFGPDLAQIAKHARLDTGEVIARHSGAEYRVAMLGFAPGFPYLLGLDPALHTPRRASPRTRVPSGAVAIGGAQTGIYPRESPGGWQLIGRTPLALFDASRESPALLAAGQHVRFRAIDAVEFTRLSR